MKNANYIPRVGPDRARKDAGRPVRSVRDKVVDLAAWKAEHLPEPDGPETDDLPVSAPARHEDRGRARRRTALDWAELAATLAVIAVFLALAVRVLVF